MSAAGVTIRTCPDGRSVFQWLYDGAPDACVTGNKPNTPTVKVTNGLAGSDYANSPSGPNATVIQTYTEATGQPEVDPAAVAAATGKPPGCCADGEANCWKCWVRDHAKWLVIIALAVAAYLLRKK